MQNNLDLISPSFITYSHGDVISKFSLDSWLSPQSNNNIYNNIKPSIFYNKKEQRKSSFYFTDIANRNLINSLRQQNQYSLTTRKTSNDFESRLYRIERDIWSLLDILLTTDLFHDINEVKNDQNLKIAVENVSIHESLEVMINHAIRYDERLKKGLVLIDWLENSFSDQIQEIPIVSSEPWIETIQLLKKYKYQNRKISSETAMKSAFPDAQLSKDFKLQKLYKDDAYDQEMALKYIWQLIRAGQVKRAQEFAVERRLFWLAGSLGGGINHSYIDTSINALTSKNTSIGDVHMMDISENNSDPQFVQCGNVKKPIWIQTCWKYSQKLASNPSNFPSTKVEPFIQ